MVIAGFIHPKPLEENVDVLWVILGFFEGSIGRRGILSCFVRIVESKVQHEGDPGEGGSGGRLAEALPELSVLIHRPVLIRDRHLRTVVFLPLKIRSLCREAVLIAGQIALPSGRGCIIVISFFLVRSLPFPYVLLGSRALLLRFPGLIRRTAQRCPPSAGSLFQALPTSADSDSNSAEPCSVPFLIHQTYKNAEGF